MKIYETCRDIPGPDKGSVIAIGNFDGVHRGHQALLGRAGEIASANGARLGVLTFEPHPRALFQPDAPPNRITPKDLKREHLSRFGVDILFSLSFDWEFASQSADAFIKNILKDGLGARHVIVGDDFRFGQLRAGSPEDIEKSGIPVTVFRKVKDEGGIEFSSSRIRQLLRHGDIAGANEILGWEWEMRGTVIGGDRRGRELGFPTANMEIGDAVHPAYGVYAARVQIEGEDIWRSAAVNIGIRPMFEVQAAQVETFIFDFSGEIYGKTLRIRPVMRLRGEAKFSSLEDLIHQMNRDCEQAREVLQKRVKG